MRRAIAPTLAAAVAVSGALGGGSSCGVSDIPVLEASGEAGSAILDAATDPDAATSCGMEGQPCCDAGCVEDGSFCSVNHSCRSAHPTDVGASCTSGATCQSGLCTYVQAFDASSGANAPSPTVCSGPCWEPSDCLPGWTCWTASEGPIVMESTGPGTCVCAPTPETCDGKDDNCDGIIDEEPGASAACTALSGLPSTCVDAGCTCIDRCDGGCVNLTDDPKNCGGCGKTCTPGLQVCSDSDCVCGGTLCPVPDGGLGDSGYVVPEGGPGGSPAACIDTGSDPNNCGGCGIVCPYACAGGCVPLLLATLSMDDDAAAEGFVPPGAIASNGSEVLILTAASGGVIEECSVTGCNQNPVTIATGLSNTNSAGSAGLLALGGSWAYWPDQAAVRDVTITTPTTSVFAQPANASVNAVATNATEVFWSDLNLGIFSCALGPTCASPSALAPMSSLAAAAQLLAADQSYVYWMDLNGDVFSLPLGGGSPAALEAGGEGVDFPLAMAASAGRVYYVDAGTGQLMTAIGGTPSSAAVYYADYAGTLATDGTTLYWSTDSTISKCALGASCATRSVIYGAAATSLAVDATNIYWIDDGSATSGVPQVWEYYK